MLPKRAHSLIGNQDSTFDGLIREMVTADVENVGSYSRKVAESVNV